MSYQTIVRMGILFLVSLLFCTACNSNNETQDLNDNQAKEDQTNHQQHDPTSDSLEVEIIMPDRLPLKKEVTLKAHLTAGKENVDDAQEVQFEVWKENEKKQSEMIDGKLDKDGVYTAKKTFEEEGIYYIQAHATARGMHVMPVKKFVVGKSLEIPSNDMSEQEQDHQHHDHE